MAATRLSLANAVALVASMGVAETVRIHDSVAESDLRMALEYCARQGCKERGKDFTYCQGCTLDLRPADDDEAPSDVWKLARTLIGTLAPEFR